MSSTEKNGRRERGGLAADVRRFLSAQRIAAGSRIVVALSGGPDSSALAAVLRELSDEFSLSLFCAYFDHGMRPEIETSADREFVSDFCGKLGVELMCGRAGQGVIEKRTKEAGGSPEDVARRFRYRFLRKTVEDLQADYLALGHTLDDQLETLVMRFFQGSGPGGLSGIPPVRDRIIRPLSDSPKSAVIEYLESRGYGYRTDPSNLRPDFLRNRVRLYLMPLIEEIFPGYRSALSAGRERMAELEGFLAAETRSRIRWRPHGNGFLCEKQEFLSAALPIRRQAVFEVFNRINRDEGQRLPYRFLNPVAELTPAAGDRIILRGYGFVLRTAGAHVFAEEEARGEYKRPYSIAINEDGVYTLPGNTTLRIVTEPYAGQCGDHPCFSTDILQPPLIVRSRKSSDTISLAGGRKSVKKLLSEWKVPLGLRLTIPVVEDRGGILAVLGGPFGYKTRFSTRCKGERLPDRMVRIFLFDFNGD